MSGIIHFKDNKAKSALSTRWAQMSKQEQIIEKKKMEIQAKLEAQKQAAALAAQAKLTNPTSNDDKSSNIFSNDGSFMSQYKALLEKQKKEKEEKEKQQAPEVKNEDTEQEFSEHQIKGNENDKDYGRDNREDRRKSDRGSRDRQRSRWNERNKNYQHSPVEFEDRKKRDTNIPSLMQIPVRPPNDDEHDSSDEWNMQAKFESNDENDDNDQSSNMMGSGPMGPPDMMGPGPMGPGPMGHNMGPGPMMGPGGPMPPWGGPPNFSMPPNWGPNGPPMPPNMCGPNGPMPPFFPPFNPSMMGPNGPPGPPNSMMGPNGPPNNMMRHSNPMMGPNGPPNRMMGPNGPSNKMMGNGPPMRPNGPPNSMIGPNGPPISMMGPNGPTNPMMGPNGPNPMIGLNGPPHPLMGPNGQSNSMMGSNRPNLMLGPNGPMNGPPGGNGPAGNMPFMGSPQPFGPNGPRFGNNGSNMPFMPSKMPLDCDSNLDSSNSDAMNMQNMAMKHSKNSGTVPQAPNVLSPDSMGGAVERAASEVAANGDHWENVLKAIHTQDQNLWFLHSPDSNEYKSYRELVDKLRKENQGEKKLDVKDEDKYEPEFSLQDDDSNDSKTGVKDESRDSYQYNNSSNMYNIPHKREASSQSDEENDVKKERKRKKKSRWGDEPPAVTNPPGVIAPLAPMPVMSGIPMPPLPPPLPGLPKIDEDGLKLTNVNRNNQALMQYAMTNYGTTNLNAEDWKKCEENFKLNLLYQDMMKKRQELDRLAAAGKHKYEYDSDEDTNEGTWEHKLRMKEMAATEKWADELTKQATGKHHIGDFLPPEELKKFMEKYSAVKSGKEPDLSDYKEFKLKEDNVGFKMLQKLGWNEGQGLGVEGTGIVEPINKSKQPVANLGLGASTSEIVSPDDDEFDAYRKRMMLAYRFRPNPLNNPRRPYY